MKKILFVLAIFLCCMMCNGQDYFVDVPINVKHEVVSEQRVKEMVSYDTIKKTRMIEKKEIVTSKIVKRSFMNDVDGTIHTILTLEDGHTISVSVVSNLTIANDVIGSEYSYYVIHEEEVPYNQINLIRKYDTTHVDVYKPKYVNLALLKVSSDVYIDGKRHFVARVYSYSLGKVFSIETNDLFYYKFYQMKTKTKKEVKRNETNMLYSDYKMLYNFNYSVYYGLKGYKFIETIVFD